MKKIILLICATTLFVACSKSSSDDAPAVQPTTTAPFSGILLKKITNTGYGGSTRANDFTYDGNKIVKVIQQGGNEVRYSYSGNLISSKNNYSGGTLTEGTSFSYTADKLTGIVFSETVFAGTRFTRFELIHNTNSTSTSITYKQFQSTNSGSESQVGSGTYTIANGNLVKDEYTYSGGVQVITYAYDTKNSPVKSVLGCNKLVYDASLFSVNNLLSTTTVTNYTSGTAPSTEINSSTYVYNTNDYPLSSVTQRTSNGGSPIVVLGFSSVYTY